MIHQLKRPLEDLSVEEGVGPSLTFGAARRALGPIHMILLSRLANLLGRRLLRVIVGRFSGRSCLFSLSFQGLLEHVDVFR